MPQNAIELLKSDHDKVRKLLGELEGSSASATKKRTELLEKIEKEIEIHTQLEEEIFYPAFKAASDGDHDKLYYEALEEHRAVGKMVLPDLKKAAPDSPEFGGRAKVLKELVEHHAKEEEDEMFPKAAKSMSKDELKDLGAKLEERKKELMRGS